MFSLAILSVSTNAAAHPHLAQAWTAMSAGDGLKGQTGKESYLYEDCKEPSDTCMTEPHTVHRSQCIQCIQCTTQAAALCVLQVHERTRVELWSGQMHQV